MCLLLPLNLKTLQITRRCIQKTQAVNSLWKSKIKANTAKSLCHCLTERNFGTIYNSNIYDSVLREKCFGHCN